MMKFSALLWFFIFAAAPLWAADETHIFEFDYDNQIEAPVLEQAPALSAAAEQSAIIPPPPLTAAGSALLEPEKEAASIDFLFMPSETAQSAKAPEKAAVTVLEKTENITPAPVTEAAKAPRAKEKTALSPKPAPVKTAARSQRAKAGSSGAYKTAAPAADLSLIRDPRFRLWLLASLAWNRPQSLAYTYGGAESIYSRQPIDLKYFPKN